MIDFIITNVNILLITGDCSILGTEFQKILNEVFNWILIAVPALVVVLCSIDLAKAVVAQDDKAIKNAQSSAIKRIIIGVVIFFVPLVLQILLDFAGIATGTCGIGG